jgi:hypothetical protein
MTSPDASIALHSTENEGARFAGANEGGGSANKAGEGRKHGGGKGKRREEGYGCVQSFHLSRCIL